MDEATLGIHTRLGAIEIVLCDMLARTYLATDQPRKTAAVHKEGMADLLSKLTVRGLPAVDSDLVTGELSDAVMELMEAAQEQVRAFLDRDL